MWMKRARVARVELEEETQHKRVRFAASAIGLTLAGLAFIVLSLAHPYLF